MMASPASISALPAELVLFVAENLVCLKDLSSLAQADRKLYSTVNPLLYRRAASSRDAWALAWAAHCGVVGTLRKVLAAGADPNHEFTDHFMLEEWKKANAAYKLAADNRDSEVWDTDNEESESNAGWSLETDDSDHAATLTTNQLSSNSNSDQWGHVFDDSDRDSDILMDEPSDADSSTLDDGDDEDEASADRMRDMDMWEPETQLVMRGFNPIHLAVRGGHDDIVKILLEHGARINEYSRNMCECTRLFGLLNAAECPRRSQPPPTWSALHIAICHSHPSTAKLLLERGASDKMEVPIDPAKPPMLDHSANALHHAAAMGLVDVVRYLLDNTEVAVDVRDQETLTPFYHAYANRRWDSTVPLLLDRGANIDVDTKMFLPYSTITPLGEACRLGNFDDADRLLDLGADPTRGFIATSTGRGLSPLHMCCMPSARDGGEMPQQPRIFEEKDMGVHRMRTIEKLVAKGALLDAKDCSGDTPLIIAAQNANVPALRAVIAAGADIHERNAVGRNAMMQAIMGPSNPPTPAYKGDSPMPLAVTLQELFRNGARLDERDLEGNTILHLVFKCRVDVPAEVQMFVLRILLNMPRVSDLCHVKNKDNKTPLQLAFQAPYQAHNIEACDILIRRSRLCSGLGRSELIDMLRDAALTHNVQAINLILDLDVNGDLTSDPSLLSDLFSKGGASDALIAHFISLRGFPPLPPSNLTHLLCQALRAGELRLAYSILDAGADVNDRDLQGDYPIAVYFRDPLKRFTSERRQMLEALLDRDANIHVPLSPGSRERVFSSVIAERSEFIVGMMLRKQPPLADDPRAVGGFYLHDAVTIASDSMPPSEKIIDLLLSSGASTAEVDEDGDTPLSVLLKSLCWRRHFTWRYHRYIKTLLGRGDVDINRRNNAGKSCADYLEELMHTKNPAGSQTTFLTRRIRLISDNGAEPGVKVLEFLPRPHKRVKPNNVRAGK
ncbi:ankyrin repeat-containing domain protein [Apodospora peruviana]|uniref:Ankyrin repeat-containing domain protein n=1 Tax=Apodospora peruviana TaxID=516989 RepID=A0AAE0M473_9PEZI|nr:ankyrin repeat-containing domain protein [Apodospora peruviana]